MYAVGGRRQWHPTPVLLPSKSHGWRSPWAAVHGVARSQTRLNDFTFTFHFHAWEKEMATHSSVLAWRIPGTGEPGGLPSIGSHTESDTTEVTQQQQQHAIGNEPAEGVFVQFSLVCISNTRKLIDCMTLSLNYYIKLIVHNTSVPVQFYGKGLFIGSEV